MRGEPSCPKCGGRVRAPGLFADSWQCDVHGAVYPLQPVIPPSVEALGVVVHRARVPVWMPWPLPVGWLFTGVAYAGDDRSGGRATAVACSGPGPLGGVGELLLVAEELGRRPRRAVRRDRRPRPGPVHPRRRPAARQGARRRTAHPALARQERPRRPGGLRGRGARAVAVGDRLARAVRAADVRRAGADRSARRGRRGRPAALRGAQPRLLSCPERGTRSRPTGAARVLPS